MVKRFGIAYVLAEIRRLPYQPIYFLDTQGRADAKNMKVIISDMGKQEQIFTKSGAKCGSVAMTQIASHLSIMAQSE